MLPKISSCKPLYQIIANLIANHNRVNGISYYHWSISKVDFHTLDLEKISWYYILFYLKLRISASSSN